MNKPVYNPVKIANNLTVTPLEEKDCKQMTLFENGAKHERMANGWR